MGINANKQIVQPMVMKKTNIGNSFTREKLGIKKPEALHGFAEYDKNCFMFFTISNDKGNTEKGYYSDELHRDGVVFEPGGDNLLVKENEKVDIFGNVSIKDKTIHVFVRYSDKGGASFEYIGDAKGFVRYDQTRNKVLVL
ncbi:MAG: hypothetical protein FWD24_05690 [Treponema sp.]|nr:hypothetical protein [Treponema sp.]